MLSEGQQDWSGHRLASSSLVISPEQSLPRPHPMSCWLLACHAPRIAKGFAHISQEQLHAGNWGLVASRRGAWGSMWGRPNPTSSGRISSLCWRTVLLFTERSYMNGSGGLPGQSLGPLPGHLARGLVLAGWWFLFLGHQLEAEPGFQRLEKWLDLYGRKVTCP